MVTLERPSYYNVERVNQWCGLSSDIKPTIGVLNGDKFYEIDTGKHYNFDIIGQEWHIVPTETPVTATSYNDLTNKPYINGVELVGNKTLAQLGINYTENNYTDAEKAIVAIAGVKDGVLQENLNADMLDGYHASYFAPMAQVSPLYVAKTGTTTSELLESKPIVSSGNYLQFIIPGAFGTLGNPLATITRFTTTSSLVLNNTNGAYMDLYGAFNGNIEVEFAIRGMYSLDGNTWKPLSSLQSFGIGTYSGNISYTQLASLPKISVRFDALTEPLELPAGSYVKYEIYARYLNNAATFRLFCGITVNTVHVYSMIQLNLQSVAIDASNLENNSVTNEKLGTDIKIGSLAALNTINKTDIVSAINEIFARLP